MTEFGHNARIIPGFACIDNWGVGPYQLGVWRFEDSDRFGPVMINRRGDPKSVQPGEKSPFWRFHRIWVRQGRRVKEDGITCIWDEPKPTRVKRIGLGSQMVIVEQGEEDGGYIEVRE